MNKRILGKEKERLVAAYLMRAGLCILEMNFSCRLGEIDL